MNLINAWIVYDKGMIPDCGTGENQRPATEKEIQEAGLYIEEFITKLKPNTEDIQELIDLLNTDGIDSKQIVINKLKDML